MGLSLRCDCGCSEGIRIFRKEKKKIFFDILLFPCSLGKTRKRRKQQNGQTLSFVLKLFWLLSNNRVCLRSPRKGAGRSHCTSYWHDAGVCKNTAQNTLRTSRLVIQETQQKEILEPREDVSFTFQVPGRENLADSAWVWLLYPGASHLWPGRPVGQQKPRHLGRLLRKGICHSKMPSQELGCIQVLTCSLTQKDCA